MKREDNPNYDSKIQKILNKLISEEVIANNFYVGCITTTCRCQASLFKDLFLEIAEDELDDHAKHLIEWAVNNDYDVPFKFKDYEKHADQDCVKQFNSLKGGQEADYYVAEGIKSEELAIKSYKEAMEYEDLPQDLNAVLLQNYYDEVEHYENLSSLKYATEAGADLANY